MNRDDLTAIADALLTLPTPAAVLFFADGTALVDEDQHPADAFDAAAHLGPLPDLVAAGCFSVGTATDAETGERFPVSMAWVMDDEGHTASVLLTPDAIERDAAAIGRIPDAARALFPHTKETPCQ